MIEWRDEGALLSARTHGETSVIIEALTRSHGRVAGIVRGGISRKLAPHIQPGAQLDLTWKARLDEHLGTFTVEPKRSRTAQVMGDRLALDGLNSLCALLSATLPEREPHPALYDRTMALLDLLGDTDLWPLAYLQWELALLDELGFGLDLRSCAVTGGNDALIYISPRSGRAVSASGAGDWADRLLPLPPVMLGSGDATGAEIAKALGTTGYFIEHRALKALGDRPLPSSRQRLVDRIASLS